MEERKSTATFELPGEVEQAAELALERKASELVVLDLRGISSATDFFLIGSGNSDIQVRAIAEHVRDMLKEDGVQVDHVEGLERARWVLLDYIDFVVHLLHPSAREFYQLENLWGDAPRMKIEG